MKHKGKIHFGTLRPVHPAAVSLLASLALFASLCLPAAAQRRYENVVEHNPWNMTSNVCGVRADSVSISQAQLYGSYTDGGFRDLSDAPRHWNAGAFAETVSHFRRISMTGRFAFDHEEAYDACGSMLSRPGAYPIDILEFTPGRKTRQTYTVNGGIAAELSRTVTVGGKMEYSSSNRAKRKDLRYTDYFLDMTVAPSLLLHLGSRATLGLSYSYRRLAESISAEELGISSESYYAFLDKGMMYGSYDVWTGGSTHLKESGVSGFPLRRNIHGAAVQFESGGFIAELSGTIGGGKAGEKDVQWYRFRSDGLSMLAGWTSGIHRATLRLSADRMNTGEDIIDKVTENGVTTTVNYGTRDIYGSTLWSVKPEYRILSGRFCGRAGVSLDFSDEVSRTVYPYVGKVSKFTGEAYVSGLYSIRGFDFGLGLSYRGGLWTDSLDNTDASVAVSAAPKRLDDLDVQGRWYAACMTHETARRLTVAASLRYSFRFGLFLDASARLARGFHHSSLLGRHRASASVGVGYAF
mgnify:CR=1 FL=1